MIVLQRYTEMTQWLFFPLNNIYIHILRFIVILQVERVKMTKNNDNVDDSEWNINEPDHISTPFTCQPKGELDWT